MDDQKGKFLSNEEYDRHLETGGPELPNLSIGEVVAIKGVRFRVQEIRSRGRLYLKMEKAPAEVAV